MKVYIKTYGCTFNQADSDRMALALREHEHEIVGGEGEADVIILNTCSVKDATQQKILHKVSRTSKPLVVAGCLVQATPAIVAGYNPSASLVGTFAQESIVEAVENAFQGKRIVSTKNNGIPRLTPYADGVFARIQINSGCASACTFCSTKLARGGVKSYRPREIIKAVEKVVAQGAKEIQLTSQDTGAYGLDCGVALPELLERICEIGGEFRIRVGMCNPQHFLRMEKDLIRVFTENEKLYKFFHVAIQSASDAVLEHMKRGYTTQQAAQAIQSIKNAFPDAMLETDVIVGYPTETREDFQKTLEFLRWGEFDMVNVSKYSARPKTVAAKLKQIDNVEVKTRSEKASALARRILAGKIRRFVGERERVLVTEKRENGFLARTNEYRPVILQQGVVGKFEEVEITRSLSSCLAGAPTSRQESILITKSAN